MKFLNCFLYLIYVSVVGFIVGRILPKKWFDAEKFPYRSFAFEKSGRIYENLKIRKWMNKLPDMSKILPFTMPEKKISVEQLEKMPRMIQETCVAEFTHSTNSLAGFFCLRLYPGIGGVIISVIYALVFNLPYIIIQRFNRPRLTELSKHIDERNNRMAIQNGTQQTYTSLI